MSTRITTSKGRVLHELDGDLAGADLSGLRLIGAQLQGQSLCGTNLSGACLTGADQVFHGVSSVATAVCWSRW